MSKLIYENVNRDMYFMHKHLHDELNVADLLIEDMQGKS